MVRTFGYHLGVVGRPTKGPRARIVQINVKLSTLEVAELDRRRGPMTRSGYLRDLFTRTIQWTEVRDVTTPETMTPPDWRTP